MKNMQHWQEEYHSNNPDLYEYFKKVTLWYIKEHGFRFLSARLIIGRMRHETALRAKQDIFKINNDITPFYAKLFMIDYPQHEGLFRLRKGKVSA